MQITPNNPKFRYEMENLLRWFGVENADGSVVLYADEDCARAELMLAGKTAAHNKQLFACANHELDVQELVLAQSLYYCLCALTRGKVTGLTDSESVGTPSCGHCPPP
ncbi:MAG: hypothetical protein LBJ12_02220 [Oscillospiraceae bacterium]|jgi:hypothetical protein|nr:hypothetical protein [Oscillospiraceae bacterium]